MATQRASIRANNTSRSGSRIAAARSMLSPIPPTRSRCHAVSGRPVERTTSSAPADLPVELPEHAPTWSLVVKGAELADEAERAANPRATPVRLRAAERIRN